jgi:nucleoid DNA-binding protein
VPVNTPNHSEINCGVVMKRFGFWLETWAPHVTTDRAADIVRRVLAQRRKLDADDDLGAKLRLSHADRQRLKIRTIGSFDVDRKSRRKLQEVKKRERDRIDAAKRRRAKGAVPRAESRPSRRCELVNLFELIGCA